MKIKKNSSIKATTWMGKYKDVKGNWKKVYFDVGSEDFDEVEELFEESISEPYTTMRLLGRAPSESLLKRDGFSKIELCSDVRSCEGSGCDLAALRRKAMSKYYTSKSITSAEEPDEDELEELEQEFSSKDTAVNGPQGKLPAVFKMISIPDGALVLDYGGGKPEAEAVAQAYLDQFNATEAIYDPFNQTQDHNREVVKLCRSNGGADIAVCSNVLNVIKEYEVRINVLKNIKKLVSPSGKVYITVYEGSGKGEGAATQKNQSYQNNRKTQGYLEEIQQVFPDAVRKGKLIVAHPSVSAVRSAQSLPSRYWEPGSEDFEDREISQDELDNIYQYLDECGNYTDYNQKVEDVAEQLNVSVGQAETIVWGWSMDRQQQSPVFDSIVAHPQGSVKSATEVNSETPIVPEPYNSYFEVEDVNPGDYDYEVGEQLDGYDCRLVAYLVPKPEYDDKIDVYPVLTDDTEFPVCDLVGGRLYPVDIDEIASRLDDEDDEDDDYVDSVSEIDPEALANMESVVEAARSVNVDSLQERIYKEAKKVMMSPEFGFTEEEVNEYLFVDVYQKDDATVVEVRADVSYDGLMMLMDALNPIVAKYDPDAYFDAETAGIATAYLFNNSVTSATNSTGVMAGERDSSWGGYVSNGMYSLERGDEDGIYYVFSDDPFDDRNDEPVFYTGSLENIKVDYPKLYEAWVKKYPKSVKAGIYDVPERPLDPPDPPEYDQEDSYEDYIEVTVDDIVVVDEDGEWDFESDECKWADSDEKFHDWYDYENHIYMDDPSGVVEKVYELLEPYIPGDPGRYHITCDVSLTYEIDGIESQITDAWFDEDHGYDYDKEVYTDNAEAEYLPKKSSVANFKFDNI